jgi:hypothetical protein
MLGTINVVENVVGASGACGVLPLMILCIAWCAMAHWSYGCNSVILPSYRSVIFGRVIGWHGSDIRSHVMSGCEAAWSKVSCG